MGQLWPYMARLDLRRNKLDDNAQTELQNFVERIPGVTSVTRDPATGDLRAKSGPQLRLVVNLDDQSAPEADAKNDPTGAGDPLADLDDPSGAAADAFLSSAAGGTTEAKLAGPDGGGAARTILAKQRGGLGESRSEALWPRIPGAAPH